MYRNPKALEAHDITTFLKTPKKVSDVALMIRQGKGLEEIVEELATKKDLAKETDPNKEGSSDEELKEEKMLKTKEYLQGIKSVHPKAFKLVTFCSTFSNGVVLTDLEDYFDLRISEIFEILVLFSCGASIDQFESREFYLESKTESKYRAVKNYEDMISAISEKESFDISYDNMEHKRKSTPCPFTLHDLVSDYIANMHTTDMNNAKSTTSSVSNTNLDDDRYAGSRSKGGKDSILGKILEEHFSEYQNFEEEEEESSED
jgi:hypothetical protein